VGLPLQLDFGPGFSLALAALALAGLAEPSRQEVA
jgi:hypothetical protein